ncbi:hydroxyacylglutathione hydrolase family protein [Leptospira ilyithenensis]|uniref:hydroxyacylglutathione hydrolase n=1 Tax=Leptospira ilyithenensis TaxID=2484901 RepID=A0A4R9LPP1_9LEPT|nr:hydroxyacylglutathione hydrolase family protein [Leptospira ilyithenensis]TGN08151.1 MBL fold metallo-hydrolase [Leptospira ilyithenensis]
MLSVLQLYSSSPLRNFSYLIYSDRNGEAVCVDPYDAKQIVTALKKLGLKLKSILNTHEHPDHVHGNLELKEETKATVFGHPDARGKIPGMDEILKESGVYFENEGDSLVAWETPGHTDCHFCFALQSRTGTHSVFSGDMIFNAGVGNCTRGGNPSRMYHTIKNRFYSIPDEVLLYPGHDYWENNLGFSESIEPGNHSVTEVRSLMERKTKDVDFLISDFGMERKINPFFRLNEDSVRNSKRLESKESLSEEELFIRLRKLRDSW